MEQNADRQLKTQTGKAHTRFMVLDYGCSLIKENLTCWRVFTDTFILKTFQEEDTIFSNLLLEKTILSIDFQTKTTASGNQGNNEDQKDKVLRNPLPM